MVWIWTLAGLALRFWKIGCGLPYVFYTDEGRYTYLALNMGGGDLNPHFFLHPSLYLYLCFLADVASIAGGVAAGIFKVPGEAWQPYRRDPTVFFIIARGVSAVLGSLTIPLTYFAGKKVWDRNVGLLGAFFLTFSFLHVQYSQIGNMDTSLTFFVMLAFVLALLAYERGELRYFVLSGLACGLAASTKYQGYETLMWGPVACVLLAVRQGSYPVRELFGKKHLLFLACFLAGFTVGTPYWILGFGEFKRDFLWNWSYYKAFGKGQLGYEGNWNWWYYLTGPLAYGLGQPLEWAGIAGLVFLLVRSTANRLLFAVFPVIYFIVAGFSRIRTSRYMIPEIPFLCLAAAYLLVSVFLRQKAETKKTVPVGLWLTGLLIAAPSLLSCLRYDYLRMQTDTRVLAGDWVRSHLPASGQFLQTGYASLSRSVPGYRMEPLDATVFNTQVQNVSSLRKLEEYRKAGFQYLILDEWHVGLVFEGGKVDPKYKETVRQYRDFLADLDVSAKLLVSFSPYRKGEGTFDSENVEVASRSLWQMKCFGPMLRVYRL